MQAIQLFDSEIKTMDIIWEHEPITAKEVSLLAAQRFNWNKNTTYTVIKKLVEKGAVRREEPGFLCTSLVQKREVQHAQTKTLIQKLFSGSKKAFFASLLEDDLTEEDLQELKELIEKRETDAF